MADSEALGIKSLETVVFYVNDLHRSHRFYTEFFDFEWSGESSHGLEESSGQRTRVYRAGNIRMTITQPLSSGSQSGRYLRRHPDGITSLVFEVDDVAKTYSVLGARGATIVDDVSWTEDSSGGRYGFFEIATPFGESTFRFVERHDFDGARPGIQHFDSPRGGTNSLGFNDFDHVTSNFLTLKPMVLWCEQVLGLEKYWGIKFHTDDLAPDNDHGSGLRSMVLWDPHSGVKFANNEPMKPHFESSQIYTFVVDNQGAGIQHVALTAGDIMSTVRGLNARNVKFMRTPRTYYDALPERLNTSGIIAIDEDIETLAELGILIDGKEEGKYLLQIFLKEAAGLYEDQSAGPFFFEIIQRKGDMGFGGGNFRALFESIEREQKELGPAS